MKLAVIMIIGTIILVVCVRVSTTLKWGNAGACKGDLPQNAPAFPPGSTTKIPFLRWKWSGGDSKYLYLEDWDNSWINNQNGKNQVPGEGARQRRICEDAELEMPSTDHRSDWLSLQDLGRDFLRVIPYTGGSGTDAPFHTGLTYSDSVGWINRRHSAYSKSGSPVPYFIWAPEKIEYKKDSKVLDSGLVWLISSPLGDDYLMTISLKSSSEEISIRRGYLVCMYPQGTHCYKESIEEKMAKAELDRATADPKLDMRYIGDTHSGIWWVSLHPIAFADREKKCTDTGYPIKPWDGSTDEFDSPDKEAELTYLLRLLGATMWNFDIFPRTMYFGNTERKVWWQNEKIEIQTQSDVQQKNTRAYVTCWYKFECPA